MSNISKILLSAVIATVASSSVHSFPVEQQIGGIVDNLILEEQQQQQQQRILQNFNVRAFLCDQNSNQIRLFAPLERDERNIRVCLEPDENTQNQEVSILKVNNFIFYKDQDGEDKDTLQQRVIDAGAAEPGSGLNCPGGALTKCFMRTELRENFFNNDGRVRGVGAVALRFNDRRERQLQLQLGDDKNNMLRGGGGGGVSDDRNLQEFAGLVDVTFGFDVEDGLNKKRIKAARATFREHWSEQETYMHGLYIAGLIIAILLCSCTIFGLVFWKRCCADVPGSWMRREVEQDEIHVMPPVGGKQEDVEDLSDTHSMDADLGPVTEEDVSSNEDIPEYNALQIEADPADSRSYAQSFAEESTAPRSGRR